MRPDSSERYAIQRPSGESAPSFSLNLDAITGFPVRSPESGTIQMSSLVSPLSDRKASTPGATEVGSLKSPGASNSNSSLPDPSAFFQYRLRPSARSDPQITRVPSGVHIGSTSKLPSK